MGLNPHALRTGFLAGPDCADDPFALGHGIITPFQTLVASAWPQSMSIGGAQRQGEYTKNTETSRIPIISSGAWFASE